MVDHRIGGRVVRMHFASPNLASAIGRAFAHLRIPANHDEPDLKISLWDSRTSGVAMARPPWSLDDYTARGDIRGHSSPRFRTSFQTHSGIFTMADLEARRAIYWIRDANTIPGYATAMPLLPILHWWTATADVQLVHAGVVGTREGAALLAGQGGAGKSNTALSCAEAGLQYLGDDFVLIELGPQTRAHSVFCTARLHAADLEQLPSWTPRVSNPESIGTDKALFFLQECLPQQLAADLPLRVILLLRPSRQPQTTWEPARSALVHRALTAVTLHALPGAGQPALDVIARTVKALPAYVLHLGTDRTGVAPAVRTLLAQTR